MYLRSLASDLNLDHCWNFLEGKKKQDRGFRVFKLAESNFKPWNAEVPHDAPALEKQLELHVDHIRDGRTADDPL